MDVLLVEHDDDDAARITRALSRFGRVTFSIVRAPSLAAAREHLKGRRFAAVVLDLGLPGSDGIATFEAIAEVAGDAAVVVLSRDDADGGAAVERGAHAYVLAEEQVSLPFVILHACTRAHDHRVASAAARTAVAPIASGLAHEINNALAVILANVEEAARVVGERPGDEHAELRTMLEEALAASQRVQLSVRDVRVFASSDDARRRVDLNAVARSCCNIAGPGIRHRARLVTELNASRPVDGHEAKLALVVMSLLANAAQAVRDGDVEGSVIVVATADEGAHVCLEVRDTGTGISERDRARIFDPFFTTKPGRAGIGLAIVRGIVSDHGATITIRPNEGRGTTVRLLLPAC
jgi:signal transduction histidine kinase